MEVKEIISLLKNMQSPLQDYAELIGAPYWAYGKQYVYPDPEDYAIEQAISALEKEERYKWHDLRKDPNDLPEGKDYYSSFVIVATESCTDFCTIARMDFSMNEWIEIGTGDDIVGEYGKVIAWRYIEPFNNDKKSVSKEE